MADNLLTEYKKIFSFFCKFLVLILVCVVLAVGIVFPFWKLAVSFPSVYTFVLLFCFVVFLFFSLVSVLRKTFTGKTKEEKKEIAKKIGFAGAQILSLVLALTFFVVFVCKGSRLLGFLSLLVGIFCYGVLSFAKNKKH